jgi:hypothetical protein
MITNIDQIAVPINKTRGEIIIIISYERFFPHNYKLNESLF